MEQKMFCWQCQETAGNKGCTVCGVCGKTADVAALQDELVFETKLLSQVTTAMRKDGKPVDKSINHIVTVNLFITITNANFDADAIKAAIAKTREVKETLAANLANPVNPAKEQIGVLATADEDIRSLRELITYGSTIYITVSSGPEILFVDVPNLVGISEESAIAKLEAAHLSYGGSESRASSFEAGTVIGQIPEAFTQIEEHAKITLIVSTGPENADD